MGTGATVAVTLAGLALTLASLLIAAKQLHLQWRPRRKAIPTFDVLHLPDGRYSVGAKNGGEGTARHIEVWLKDPATDQVTAAVSIGSLIPNEVLTPRALIEPGPLRAVFGPLELWYTWVAEDDRNQGPYRSKASLPGAAEPDWQPDLSRRWSLPFVVDPVASLIYWGGPREGHSEILKRLARDGDHVDGLAFGRVLDDWTVEVYGDGGGSGQRDFVRQLAIDTAPRNDDGSLRRER